MSIKEKLSALERGQESHIPRQRSKAYIILPLIVLVFAALFAWRNWDRLKPGVDVEVTSAMAVKAKGTQHTRQGEVLFQAAGWVEPDPFTTKITSFVPGILDSVEVIDGQKVKKGQLLAVINQDDIKLKLKEKQASVLQGKAALLAAREMAAEAGEMIKHLDFRVKSHKVACEKLKHYFDTLNDNKSAIPRLELEQAELDWKKQAQQLVELQNESRLLKAQEKVKNAAVKKAEADLAQAQISVGKAELDLKRCHITAPVDGVVMDLEASPGSTQGPGKTVMQLFSPDKLQVRVDVLFADAPGLQIGQEASIKLDALPEQELKGRVTSIVGQADLQRNTIQAKVKILNPHPLLRPEMLARVKFQGMASKNAANETSERIRCYIPEKGLKNINQNLAEVWVVSRSQNKATKRQVEFGNDRRDGWVEIREGIQPGEWIVIGETGHLSEGRKVDVKIKEANNE